MPALSQPHPRLFRRVQCAGLQGETEHRGRKDIMNKSVTRTIQSPPRVHLQGTKTSRKVPLILLRILLSPNSTVGWRPNFNNELLGTFQNPN